MSEGVLYVTDSRTSLNYQISIHRNAIKAIDFQSIKCLNAEADLADQVGNGLRLFDPGFKNTAVSESRITFVDGAQGIVQFRGHNIADFWETAEFEDLAHLLVYGQWPAPAEKEALRIELVKAANKVPESVIRVIQGFPRTAAPMQMIIAGLAAYLREDPKSIPAYAAQNLYYGNLPLVDKAIIRTLAAFQVCAGLAACHCSGIPFTPIDAHSSFLSNLLIMMGKVDKDSGKPDPNAIRAIQRIWALGADLGHTNSTSALLLGASTLSDPLSCLISALSSGYGVLRFGAAEAAFKSLAAVGSTKNVPCLIEKVKKRKAKLFGYGHRMFQTVDPRPLFGTQILNDLDTKHPLVEVALEIDRIAGEDEYFVSRNLQANADLLIGLAYTVLDFEPSFIPVMIALMRSGGMMAHWREAMSQPRTNIWRPQQLYTGPVSPTPIDKTAKAAENAADSQTTVLQSLINISASEKPLKNGNTATPAKTKPLTASSQSASIATAKVDLNEADDPPLDDRCKTSATTFEGTDPTKSPAVLVTMPRQSLRTKRQAVTVVTTAEHQTSSTVEHEQKVPAADFTVKLSPMLSSTVKSIVHALSSTHDLMVAPRAKELAMDTVQRRAAQQLDIADTIGDHFA